ncbi:Polyadenylate-binding protein 8 [Cardamine amara subsp. amara]|uniref:Polyadenylate-binding protein 8 n=1 Tax=Cardamine amara subsp. amara TaxID=228776 RepID=A0ABD1A2S9_CARAN
MDTTTLFVWGFDPKVEETELHDLVYNNGEGSIVSVSIERDEMQNSLGRARVVFRNREDAENARTSNMNPVYMSLESFPEWTIPMTQVPTSLPNPIGSAMYRNPHAQEPVPLLNLLGSSMDRNPHAQEPMMHHFPLLIPLGSSMDRNPHAQEPVPLLNLLGSSMDRNPHAQESMMHHVPLLNPLGRPMYRNPHAQEPVRHHVPHLQWRNQIRDGMARKLILYVCNFSYELEEADLKNMFLQFGEVTSCTIRRHKDTGRSRGDGFVHFSTTEEAERATVLNGQIFDERQIWVSFAKAKSEV